MTRNFPDHHQRFGLYNRYNSHAIFIIYQTKSSFLCLCRFCESHFYQLQNDSEIEAFRKDTFSEKHVTEDLLHTIVLSFTSTPLHFKTQNSNGYVFVLLFKKFRQKVLVALFCKTATWFLQKTCFYIILCFDFEFNIFNIEYDWAVTVLCSYTFSHLGHRCFVLLVFYCYYQSSVFHTVLLFLLTSVSFILPIFGYPLSPYQFLCFFFCITSMSSTIHFRFHFLQIVHYTLTTSPLHVSSYMSMGPWKFFESGENQSVFLSLSKTVDQQVPIRTSNFISIRIRGSTHGSNRLKISTIFLCRAWKRNNYLRFSNLWSGRSMTTASV